MRPREWWLINDKTNGWRARVNKPEGESVHVLEAAPVLADLDAIYRETQGG